MAFVIEWCRFKWTGPLCQNAQQALRRLSFAETVADTGTATDAAGKVTSQVWIALTRSVGSVEGPDLVGASWSQRKQDSSIRRRHRRSLAPAIGSPTQIESWRLTRVRIATEPSCAPNAKGIDHLTRPCADVASEVIAVHAENTWPTWNRS